MTVDQFERRAGLVTAEHGGTLSVPTAVANLTLLCVHHDRHHGKLGWKCTMQHGVPYWFPLRWIDHERIPRRNKANHPPLAFPTPATAHRRS